MKHLLKRSWFFSLIALLALSTLVYARFSDVPQDHWAADEIEQAAELEIFNGTSATTFGTGETLSRGAFLVSLCRMMDWELLSPATPSFTDCTSDTWYYQEVETALAQGVITALSDTVRPDDAITREEMAVCLVRALGYQTLAGLDATQDSAFTDLTTNPGYIAMASDWGLMTGTTHVTFSPNVVASREEAAVTLMRLYDKQEASSQSMGIVYDVTDTQSLTASSTVAVAAVQMSAYALRLSPQIPLSSQQSAVDTIHEAKGVALLHVSATTEALSYDSQAWATLIADYADSAQYDGVFLDVNAQGESARPLLTQLVETLSDTLDGILYVAVDGATTFDNRRAAYDYVALSQACDGIVIQVAAYAQNQDSFLIAPMDPLEEVYYALNDLSTEVDMSKVILQITTTATLRTNGKNTNTVSGQDLTSYLDLSTTLSHESLHYGATYLTSSDTIQFSAWYLDGDDVAQRQNLAALFDVTTFCASSLHSLLPEVSACLF